MPAKYYRIFDFDQTLTQNHTFQSAQLTDENQDESFNLGAHDGHSNAKKNIPPKLLQLDSDHTFAIATYHNNPNYIAVFLQTLLGKKIRLSRNCLGMTKFSTILF